MRARAWWAETAFNHRLARGFRGVRPADKVSAGPARRRLASRLAGRDGTAHRSKACRRPDDPGRSADDVCAAHRTPQPAVGARARVVTQGEVLVGPELQR